MQNSKLTEESVKRMQKALRKFGYTDLDFQTVEDAGKKVLAGEDVSEDVIATFVRGFLKDAGLVK